MFKVWRMTTRTTDMVIPEDQPAVYNSKLKIGNGRDSWDDLPEVGKKTVLSGSGIDVNVVPWSEWTFYSDASLSSTHQYNPLTAANAYSEIDVNTADGDPVDFAYPGAHTLDFVETGLYLITTTVVLQTIGLTDTDPAKGAVRWTTTGVEGSAQRSLSLPYDLRGVPSGVNFALVLPALLFPVLSANTHAFNLIVLCDSGGDSDELSFTADVSAVKML